MSHIAKYCQVESDWGWIGLFIAIHGYHSCGLMLPVKHVIGGKGVGTLHDNIIPNSKYRRELVL